MNITTEEALAIGGSEWTGRDGKHRVYLSICDLMGVETERYKSGNVSYAARNGVKISNAEASRIMGVSVFVAGGELVITGAESVRTFTAADIEAAVADRLAEVKPAEATTDETEGIHDTITPRALADQLGATEDDVYALVDQLITLDGHEKVLADVVSVDNAEGRAVRHEMLLTVESARVIARQLNGTGA
jgi:hypothetical protein